MRNSGSVRYDKVVAFDEIAEFDRVDERISIVNTVFNNLIGVNEDFVELSSEQNPPTRSELLAWAWVIDPLKNKPSRKDGTSPQLIDLIRELYDR